MLGPADLDAFGGRGWLAVEGCFDHETMNGLIQAATRCSEEMAASPTTGSEMWKKQHFDGEDEEAQPRKITTPFDKDEAFRQVALAPRLRALATQLLMGREAKLMTDQLFLKPPKVGSAKPYHQDNFYFRCNDSGHLLTAWVALEDADEDNGCLTYIEGSHTNGIIEHVQTDPTEPYNLNAPLDEVDKRAGGALRPREVYGRIHKGGVVFHHGATLHASGANKSDRWRRGYALHFCAEGAGFLPPDATASALDSSSWYCNRPGYDGWVEHAKC